MKTSKDNSRQPDGRLHEQPQETQQQRHEQPTLHSQPIQASPEQQSQEMQTQSQKKDSKNEPIGATDHKQSRLHPSLSDYHATEAGQQYSYEELAVAMTPDRIERRRRLRQELRDSLRGIPIPPQPEVETAHVSREASVRYFENDLQGSHSNVPLSPAYYTITLRKRRQATGTNPEDLRRLEDCLPDINSSLDRTPSHYRRKKISFIQGTQTDDSDIGREHELTRLGTAASPSHIRGKLRHVQEDASPKSTDFVGDTEGEEEERPVRGSRHRTRSLPQCHDCEQNVTSHDLTKRPKRLAYRLLAPTSEEPSITQGQQVTEERPKKKRNIRVISGRFTALDSSDEEEDQQEYDRRQAQRRLKRMKLYNPRIDEIMKWTHDSSWKHTSLDTWRCPECEQRTRKTEQSCTFCSAPRPGPPILNTIPIWKLREMKQEAKNMEKSSSFNVVDSNARAAALVSGSTGFTSTPVITAFVPVATTALPLPFAIAVSKGSYVSSSQLAPVMNTTEPMTTAVLLPPPAISASGGSFIGAQLAPAIVTATSMKTSAVGTLRPLPSSSTGIHATPGIPLTQSSSVTSPNTFSVTAVPLATTNAITTASLHFGLASSSLQSPQLVQRGFQFGGFNAPSPLTFSAAVLPTRDSTKTSSMPSSVLGSVVLETTTASSMTSMSAAPLSFNPFAAAGAAILGPFAAPSPAGLVTSFSASAAAGPTYGITINSSTSAPMIASPAPGPSFNTQFIQPASSIAPLRSSIILNASATSAGSSMFAYLNPSTPIVPQPVILASTRTAPTRYSFFSSLTPSVAKATNLAPRPFGGPEISGAFGSGSISSTANANFTFGQQTTITPTPTPSSLGFGASTQASNMLSGSACGLFGNGFSPSANRWASTTFATTSGSGHNSFESTLTATSGNLLTTGHGFGTSTMSGVQGSMDLLGALAGASVGIATGLGFGAPYAVSGVPGMATGSGLNGGINITIGPGIPSTSAPTNLSQSPRPRRLHDHRNSRKRKKWT
ncbi:hypothetical protein BGZ96_007418 [Linnemannia gamsii]|uniref:RanBP2-type domain-containing protein n=1 Tax=Linnemannia gamsii TaxID=64522 RepID=A0ABQ7K1G3_9FUNG|nr:hypothetical protein BGZ96_007418 [Linnemannia gamsii]